MQSQQIRLCLHSLVHVLGRWNPPSFRTWSGVLTMGGGGDVQGDADAAEFLQSKKKLREM